MAPSSYSLTHLSDQTLLRDLAALVARDRATTATLLAHLAEVDERKLYLPAGYRSLYLYCLHELNMSEDAACKRIRAARAARQFPAIFTAVAEGRLHLSAVVMLAPHLTAESGSELMAAATRKNKSEVEHILAQRFPRPDIPARLQSLSPPLSLAMSAPKVEEVSGPAAQPAPELVGLSAPGRIEPPAAARPKVTPLAPERYALQLTIGQGTRDKLRYAQELLSHRILSRDVAQVLDRALDALIRQLEKTKFAATEKPRPSHRGRAKVGRYIPAEIKRAIWQRDGGQCTFVSSSGHRCPSRTLLEFDHMDEVARGGQATVERMRLRCRAHNQYAAECTFGTDFMAEKRHEARRLAKARAAAKARAVAKARALAKARARAPAHDRSATMTGT